jgi:hypothetical protein
MKMMYQMIVAAFRTKGFSKLIEMEFFAQGLLRVDTVKFWG